MQRAGLRPARRLPTGQEIRRAPLRPAARGGEVGAGPGLERAARLGHDPARIAVRRDDAAGAAPPVRLRLDPAAVQRLTGFEIEARIPIYDQPEGADAGVRKERRKGFTPHLAQFLFGGLTYGSRYGQDLLGRFTISADHNEILAAHRGIVDLLALIGFLDPGIDPDTMSSIEYITPPRDETGPSGKALMEEDVAAVREHAGPLVSQARQDQVTPVELTGDHVLTGVPKGELRAWVEMHGGAWELFAPVVEELEKTISDQLYLQQTTGVLPEDLPQLYGQASERLGQSGDRSAKVMAEVLALALKVADQAWSVAFASAEPPKPFAERKNAVVGYLAFLANYLFADSLSLTTLSGSTEKNLFAFLPKTSLAQSFQALPEAVRAEGDAWEKLLGPFFEAAGSFGPDYWQSHEGLSPRPNTDTTQFFGATKEQGYGPAQHVVQQLVLTGSPGEEPLKAQLGLDEPHPEVFERTGQKGIPLEDRYFQEKLDFPTTVEAFGKAASFAFGESQERLLGHVPKSGSGIREGASQPIDPQEKEKRGIAALRKRLDGILESLQKRIQQTGEEIDTAQEAAKLAEAEIEKLTTQTSQEELSEGSLSGEEDKENKEDNEDELSSDSDEEDPQLFRARFDLEMANKKIEAALRNLDADSKLLEILVSLATSDSDLSGTALLEDLHRKAIEAEHLAQNAEHRVRTFPGDVYFVNARKRLLSRVNAAATVRQAIKPEKLSGGPKEAVEVLLQQADNLRLEIPDLGSLEAGAVNPEDTGGTLLAFQGAVDKYVRKVAEARELYENPKI